MARPVELLQQGSKAELWQMCCGFIDLSMEQSMAVQKRLLLEQIELLKGSGLGRKVMRGSMPETIDEFREQVPLTTYADYCPELQERREHTLPSKAAHWIRTSGYSGTYDIKWVPWSDSFAQEVEKACAASILFALAHERGDTSQVREHWKVLYTIGGPEYATGILGYLTQQAFNFEYLPSTPGELTFTERIRAGFAEALYKGLDGFGGLPSVLVTVGQQMKEQPKKPDVTFLREHPRALLRLAKGLAKSKLAGRAMLPKDLWDIKAIIGGGTDSAVFSRTVEEMWGKRPLELYGGTEGGLYAIQTWDYEGMTFVPTLNFFEFIPEEEHFKWQIDPSYQPRTILLDEVRPGRNYEIVITNLHGGALVRFRLGDMITIKSLRNEKLNIDLPQMIFYGRADYVIDIAGLGRLTERIIWEAIENTGIPYVDWTAHKEARDNKAVLHVYVEPRHKDGLSEPSLATSISRELNRLDGKYHHNPYNIYDDETVANTAQHDSSQIEVTLLPQGAFSNYIAQRQAEGADLGHLKPPHINPSQKALTLLGKVEVPAQPERSVAAAQ